jgi:hypothetical protein
MEASLLRMARVSPARLSRSQIFCSRRLDGGDKNTRRIGLSRSDISTCD